MKCWIFSVFVQIQWLDVRRITKMVLLYIYIFPSDIQHVVSLQVFTSCQSLHILWYTRLLHFALDSLLYPIMCSFYTHVPWPFMIVCSRFLSLTPLISFTSANFPRLTRVFCYNWGSTSLHWQVLLKECVQVSFSAPRQCLSCSALRLTVTQVSFILLPFLPFCFASHILFLTSSFLVFCPRCDLAFSLPSLTSPQGLSCSSLYLSEHPAHCPSLPYFSPWKRNETGASCLLFIIFHSLCSLPVLRVAILPPTPPTYHPRGLPSVKFFNSSHLVMFWGFFSERERQKEILVSMCMLCERQRKRDSYGGVSSFRLFSREQESQ